MLVGRLVVVGIFLRVVVRWLGSSVLLLLVIGDKLHIVVLVEVKQDVPHGVNRFAL